MARKADRHFLLDTSAVIYQLHGHRLQKAAVAEAGGGGTVEVPVLAWFKTGPFQVTLYGVEMRSVNVEIPCLISSCCQNLFGCSHESVTWF